MSLPRFRNGKKLRQLLNLHYSSASYVYDQGDEKVRQAEHLSAARAGKFAFIVTCVNPWPPAGREDIIAAFHS